MANGAIENDWIEWTGGECPVAPETVVDVRFRNGEEDCSGGAAEYWTRMSRGRDWWKHEGAPWGAEIDGGNEADIIAYRVVSA